MRIVKHAPPPVQHEIDILGLMSGDFSLLLRALMVTAYPGTDDLTPGQKDRVKILRTELITLSCNA